MTDAHQVSRFVGWQLVERVAQELEREWFGLANAETADGEPRRIFGGGASGCVTAEVAKHAALDQCEQRLVRANRDARTASPPRLCALQRNFGFLASSRGGDAFVERHDQV